jgi:flagellar biosynthesis GTPase FlhF
LLAFLADASASKGSQGGNNEEQVARQILSANPILEAFGNAKTVRNDNSSRFGKFIKVYFDDGGRIAGSDLTVYLLEKSRIARQGVDERNYHVFYQFLAGASPAERRRYLLLPAAKYHYLNQSGTAPTIEGVDDAANYAILRRALGVLHFSDDEQSVAFQLLSAILLLGNVMFAPTAGAGGGEGAQVRNVAVLDAAARLLQVDGAKLRETLCNRSMGSANRASVYTIPLKVPEAEATRDALAKAIYSKLFDWLVARINETLSPSSSPAASSSSSSSSSGAERLFIGVLDIFGFEAFEHNSFEQLCINYANEKLQHFFNEHIFRAEEAEYRRENIPWTSIAFVDNQQCLDLLEQRPTGLLLLLDEECRFPRASDASFLQKSDQQWASAPGKRFKRPLRASPTSFSIEHFAGQVVYDVTGFLEKNRDTLHHDLIACVQSSAQPLVRNFFPTSSASSPGAAASSSASSRRRTATVGSQFRSSLAALMDTLLSTEPHFVRTLKPNTLKQASNFDLLEMTRQLRNAGVLECVRIRKAGFALRADFESFFNRYALLCPSIENSSRSGGSLLLTAMFKNYRPSVEQLFQKLSVDASLYALGTNKVFLRQECQSRLDALRRQARDTAATNIQRIVRGWLARIRFRLLIRQERERQRLERERIERERLERERQDRERQDRERQERERSARECERQEAERARQNQLQEQAARARAQQPPKSTQGTAPEQAQSFWANMMSSSDLSSMVAPPQALAPQPPASLQRVLPPPAADARPPPPVSPRSDVGAQQQQQQPPPPPPRARISDAEPLGLPRHSSAPQAAAGESAAAARRVGGGGKQRKLVMLSELGGRGRSATLDQIERGKKSVLSEAEAKEQARLRREVIKEIHRTETDYVRDLVITVDIFMNPLRLARDGLRVTEVDIQAVFSNVEMLLPVNRVVLDSLSETMAQPFDEQCVGQVFLALGDYLRMYAQYCTNQTAASERLKAMRASNKRLSAWLDKTKRSHPECRGLGLVDYLIKPLQRLTRYPLLLRELLKRTDESHCDHRPLTLAFAKIQSVVAEVNERQRQMEDSGRLVEVQRMFESSTKDGAVNFLTPTSRLLAELDCKSVSPSNRMARRHLLLFNDQLVIARTRGKNKLSAKSVVPITSLAVDDVSELECGKRNAFMMISLHPSGDAEQNQDMLFVCKRAAEKLTWISQLTGAIAARQQLRSDTRQAAAEARIQARELLERELANTKTLRPGQRAAAMRVAVAQSSPALLSMPPGTSNHRRSPSSSSSSAAAAMLAMPPGTAPPPPSPSSASASSSSSPRLPGSPNASPLVAASALSPVQPASPSAYNSARYNTISRKNFMAQLRAMKTAECETTAADNNIASPMNRMQPRMAEIDDASVKAHRKRK